MFIRRSIRHSMCALFFESIISSSWCFSALILFLLCSMSMPLVWTVFSRLNMDQQRVDSQTKTIKISRVFSYRCIMSHKERRKRRDRWRENEKENDIAHMVSRTLDAVIYHYSFGAQCEISACTKRVYVNTTWLAILSSFPNYSNKLPSNYVNLAIIRICEPINRGFGEEKWPVNYILSPQYGHC